MCNVLGTAYLLDERENTLDKKEFSNRIDAVEWFKESYIKIVSGDGEVRIPSVEEMNSFMDFYDVIYECDVLPQDGKDETIKATYIWRLVPL